MLGLDQNERRAKKGTAIAKNLRAGFPATHTDTLHLTATHTQEKLLGRLLARANPIIIYSTQHPCSSHFGSNMAPSHKPRRTQSGPPRLQDSDAFFTIAELGSGAIRK